jgi:hypothetical protein
MTQVPVLLGARQLQARLGGSQQVTLDIYSLVRNGANTQHVAHFT